MNDGSHVTIQLEPAGRIMTFAMCRSPWHQVWMGANGSPLRLEGNPDRPGRMILSGPVRTTPQGTVRDRITWTLQDDGTVEQHWDISTDGGSTWQTGFRGIYRPAE